MGNVYLRYSDPIDLDNFTEVNRKLNFRELSMKLTKQLLQFQFAN